MMNYEPRDAVRLVQNPPVEIVDKVCKGCPLFPTKSGNEPIELRAALNEALELEEIMSLGIVPSFTDVMNGGLTIRQLAALKGIKQGRDKAERLRHSAIKKQMATNQQAKKPIPNNETF